MNIRKVQKSDNTFLSDLIKEVFEEHNAPKEGTIYSDPTTDNLYQLFKKEKAVLWVIEENNEILGCSGVYPTKELPNHCTELVKFYLSPKARGKGWGTKLMESSIKSAIDLGYTEIYLECFPQFANAVKMYEKLGFRKLEKPLGNSGHISCDIWMIMKLFNGKE